MAKQAGPLLLEGTIDNLTFYKMDGKHYTKKKSAISPRRIREDPAFANTRRNGRWFGNSSTLASKVYRELPLDRLDRKNTWYPMKERARVLVIKELPGEEILRILREEFIIPLKKGKKQLVSAATHTEGSTWPPVEIPDDVMAGRALNKNMELLLIDQLSASRAFVKSILVQKNILKSYTNRLAGLKRLRR